MQLDLVHPCSIQSFDWIVQSIYGAVLSTKVKFYGAKVSRKQPEELAKLAEGSEAQLVPWQKGRCLFVRDADLYMPLLLCPLSRYVKHLDATIGHIFMGIDPDTKAPIFAGTSIDFVARS